MNSIEQLENLGWQLVYKDALLGEEMFKKVEERTVEDDEDETYNLVYSVILHSNGLFSMTIKPCSPEIPSLTIEELSLFNQRLHEMYEWDEHCNKRCEGCVFAIGISSIQLCQACKKNCVEVKDEECPAGRE